MKKSVQVNVSNIGEKVGTVGWLLEQDIEISVGTSESGYCACWLTIGGRRELVGLEDAVFNAEGGFYASRGYALCELVRVDLDHGERAFDVVWTDAAWGRVQELAGMAFDCFVEALVARDESEQSIAIEWSVTRS